MAPVNSSRRASWEDVREVIDMYLPAANVNVNIGGPDGEIAFRHDKGDVDDDTEGRIFSASKWISGVTVMAVVADGDLDLEDLASKHLPWWSTTRDDPRSLVTLRHLLGFTSGLIGVTGICPAGGGTFLECCETTYGTTMGDTAPGELFTYLEIHIQFAACMAAAATGKGFDALVQEKVFGPSQMRRTTWLNPANIQPGSGLLSTPGDYKLFLRKYFLQELLPQNYHLQMERDQYPAAERLPFPNEGWHYGFTNWFECPAGVTVWGKECQALRIHSSGGTAGFRPQIDRRYNYYLLVGYYGTFGIGGEVTKGLAQRLRPLLAEIFGDGGDVVRLGMDAALVVGPAKASEQ